MKRYIHLLQVFITLLSLSTAFSLAQSQSALPAVSAKIIEIMEGFREQIPAVVVADGVTLDYGEFYVDETGKRWGYYRLAKASEKLPVKQAQDLVFVAIYLRDKDPKLRYIAGTSIRNFMKSEINVIDLASPDSYTKCVTQLCAELEEFLRRAKGRKQETSEK